MGSPQAGRSHLGACVPSAQKSAFSAGGVEARNPGPSGKRVWAETSVKPHQPGSSLPSLSTRHPHVTPSLRTLRSSNFFRFEVFVLTDVTQSTSLPVDAHTSEC